MKRKALKMLSIVSQKETINHDIIFRRGRMNEDEVQISGWVKKIVNEK